MEKKDNQTSGAVGIQVFELTMDNPEDQDELNRRLHKPAESNGTLPATIGRGTQGDSTAASAGKSKEAT
jgi:hypothetical protein